MRRRKPIRLTPVERAVMRQKWAQATVDAHLQALMGGSWPVVIDRVASLLYIVGKAADLDNVPDTDTDLRIIHGASKTALDVCAAESITPLQRGSLEAGLLAIERLKPRLSDESMCIASTRLQTFLKSGGVYWGDFEEFVK